MFQDIKCTRGNALELKYILETSNFEHPLENRFRYMVSKNLEVLQKESDEVNNTFPVPEELTAYANKRREIYKKFKIKDESAYKELDEETKKILDSEITKLEDDNKSLLEEVDKLEKEKNEFLKDEITIKLYKLNIDLMPKISEDNKISGWDIWFILLKYVIIEPDN